MMMMMPRTNSLFALTYMNLCHLPLQHTHTHLDPNTTTTKKLLCNDSRSASGNQSQNRPTNITHHTPYHRKEKPHSARFSILASSEQRWNAIAAQSKEHIHTTLNINPWRRRRKGGAGEGYDGQRWLFQWRIKTKLSENVSEWNAVWRDV